MMEPGKPSSTVNQSSIPASAGGGPVPAVPNSPLLGTSPGGPGVLGQSNTGAGLRGESLGEGGGTLHGIPQPGSPPGDGVYGRGATGVHGVSASGGDGVFGEGGNGVHGRATIAESGVWGEHPGLAGHAGVGIGVKGTSVSGDGVYGTGARNGVHGQTASPGDSGVWGENTGGGNGVAGSTNSAYQAGASGTAGVWGSNFGSGIGVKGTSTNGDAVVGVSTSTTHAGVSAVNDSGGFGVWARGAPAGHFEGNIEVTGDLNCAGNVHLTSNTADITLANQDCAEDFEMLGAEEVDPGNVVVIDSGGVLKKSHEAYDRRVAGVISGAGEYRPGIVLGRQQAQEGRMPVALVGKVYCKVDAGYSPIKVGDLLTTSPTPGHAMKAQDQVKAFGAVIGKALHSLEVGQGLIPILVALQ
jgi:hypothetical protein